MISQNEVRHIAKLAKLNLSDVEVEKFSAELSSILDFFDQLKEVDTEKTEETSQVTGLHNVVRRDEIYEAKNKKELIGCTPHQVEGDMIRIPRIM